jgi:hypothetical protein
VNAKLLHHLHGDVDRHRKGQADGAAARAEEEGVHPHDLAAQVEQRSARVSRVHGDVGLDEPDVRFRGNGARRGADDAGRDRAFKAEGRPDGHHPFARLQQVRLADAHAREPGCSDLDQADVRGAIHPHDAPQKLAPVGEAHDHLIVGGVFDYVVRGHNVAVGAHEKARAERRRIEVRPCRAPRAR